MRALAVTGLLLFGAACSRSAIDGTIGPAGGVREAEGGARLDVPAGALKTEEAIAMSRVGTFPAPPQGVTFKNGVYELTPHGQKFQSAVLVHVPASAGEVLLTADLGGTAWTVIDGAQFEEGGLTGSVTHFSYFAAATTTQPLSSARIFFSDGPALRAMDPDGGTLETLVPGARPSRSLTGIAVDAASRAIFWSDDATAKVSRIGYDVSGQVVLATTVGAPKGVAVDATHGRIFWAEGTAVRMAGLDGGAAVTVATGVSPSSVAVDPGAQRVYWTDDGTDAVKRTDYSGAGTTLLYQSANPLSNPRGLAIDVANGKLFWAEGADVKTSGLDGTLVAVVVAGAAASVPSAIAADPKAKRLYWTDTGADSVLSAPYTGTPVKVLFTGASDPQGVAVDPGK